MALKPLQDRIIVEPSAAETTTSSGIILPDSAQEKPQRGKVLAVGPGKMLDTGKLSQMDIKVGETVLYGKYSGTEIKLSGVDYVILRQEDVLAVVEGAPSSERAVAAAGGAKKGKK